MCQQPFFSLSLRVCRICAVTTRYMGDHFNNPTYQPASIEQDKNLVNARVGWRNDNWDAALWVKNATDEAYASLSAAPLAYSGTEAYFLEAPRTWGATVRYNF